jgi:hypothetical protein
MNDIEHGALQGGDVPDPGFLSQDQDLEEVTRWKNEYALLSANNEFCCHIDRKALTNTCEVEGVLDDLRGGQVNVVDS